MKNRGGEEGGGGGGGPEHTTMKKTRKRLGGKGLSLDAFVGANRVKPAVVTASQIRKQREAYQNSKKVNKYRKTLKHLAEEGHEFRPRVPLSLSNVDDVDAKVSGGQGAGPQGEEASAAGGETGGGAEKGGQRKKRLRQPKPVSHLERLREEYETKKQEEEEVRREKRALFEEQQAAREKSKQERKGVQKKFRKTTGKGQPVMKHRMEHLLDSIQKDMNTSR